MSFPELLEAVRKLPPADKVRLMHELVDQVARPNLPPDDVIRRALVLDAVHGPQGAEAAAVLQRLLQEEAAKA
jgi:hypothetical protein